MGWQTRCWAKTRTCNYFESWKQDQETVSWQTQLEAYEHDRHMSRVCRCFHCPCRQLRLQPPSYSSGHHAELNHRSHSMCDHLGLISPWVIPDNDSLNHHMYLYMVLPRDCSCKSRASKNPGLVSNTLSLCIFLAITTHYLNHSRVMETSHDQSLPPVNEVSNF